jgi:hypothetical protein
MDQFGQKAGSGHQKQLFKKKKKKKKWLLPPEMKFIKPLSTQELCVHMAPRVLEGIKVETNLYLGVSG